MSKLSILKQKTKRDVDMTQGSIFRHLITFAFPLLIGNIFQQLYNTVDTWVVGNYVSNEAFSAVGTVGPVINMLIGIFLGLSSGAGVVISQYYGAKRYDKVRDTVHTSIVMTLILACALYDHRHRYDPLRAQFHEDPGRGHAGVLRVPHHLLRGCHWPYALQHGRGHSACRG